MDDDADAGAAATAPSIISAVHGELPGLEAAIAPLVHALLAFRNAHNDGGGGRDSGGGHRPRPVRGVVIEGPSDVGKTSLARAGKWDADACKPPPKRVSYISSSRMHTRLTILPTIQNDDGHAHSGAAYGAAASVRGGLLHLRPQPR